MGVSEHLSGHRRLPDCRDYGKIGPRPREFLLSFLITSVIAVIRKAAKLPSKDAANIGLAVFAGSAPTSMFVPTGDSSLNVAAFANGITLSWLQWFKYMSVPSLAAFVLSCLVQLHLFKPLVQFERDEEAVRKGIEQFGLMNAAERSRPWRSSAWRCPELAMC